MEGAEPSRESRLIAMESGGVICRVLSVREWR